MKERILAFLMQLADQSNASLMDQLISNTGLPQSTIVANAKVVVSKILHQYAQFSVSTIDAFFQKVVKSFAKELGLLGNYKVELDQDMIKKELIDQIMDELGNDAELAGWLVEFSFTRVDNNKSWNIRPQIESLSNEVFKESFREVEKDLQKIGRQDFKKFLATVTQIKTGFESHIKSLAQKASGLMRVQGLEVEDFAFGTKGPAGYFDRIVIRNDYEPKARVNEAIGNHDKWFTKSSTKKDAIRQCLAAGMLAYTQEIVTYYEKNIQEYATAVEVLRNFYVYGIFTEIIRKLKAYRKAHDVMLISDVPVFLRGIIDENDAPFIYEKTGSRYQHYLIDEFQDTSHFQWQNFKPLIENSLAQGYKSLLVGDGKQSIYRWRGGDWKLILHQVKADLQSWLPNEKHLNTNWRSDGKIVQFNNDLFAYIPGLLGRDFGTSIAGLTLPEEDKRMLNSRAMDVQQLYEDVAQQIAPKHLEPLRGAIEINVFAKEDPGGELTWKMSALEALPGQIETLQEAGFEAQDIAVLVRKGDEGKQVIEQLLKYKKSSKARAGFCYDAISNESLFLGNAPAIRLIINTLRYAVNPENKIAFGEIAYYYHTMQTGDGATHADLNFMLDGSVLPADFLAELPLLVRRPVYEMVERIVQIFGLGEPTHTAYLQAFQDVVLEYFANESKDVADFWNGGLIKAAANRYKCPTASMQYA